MGQIVSSAAKPKRCNLNRLSQVPTPAAGEYILVSSDNSMNAAGRGNFDCYIMGNGSTAATALPLNYINEEKTAVNELLTELFGAWDVYPDHDGALFATVMMVRDGITHKAIPLSGGGTLQIKANSVEASAFYLAKSYTIPASSGTTNVNFASGETERRIVNAGATSAVISIPSDARFLIIKSLAANSVNAKPDSILINGDDILVGKFDSIHGIIGDGDVSGIERYASVEKTSVNGKYIDMSLQEHDSTDFEYAYIQVSAGEKYYVEGWNLGSSIPAALFAKSGTTNTARALADSSAKGMSGVVSVPNGYDILYVNGRPSTCATAYIRKVLQSKDLTQAANNLNVSTSFKDALCPLYVRLSQTGSVGTYDGVVMQIAKRFDENYDVVWKFLNRMNYPNKFFDFYDVSLVSRGADAIQHFIPSGSTTQIVGSAGDFIAPIQVAAVNNKDGDFSDDNLLFTGGAHGYNGSTATSATATMREISRDVRLDGIPMELGESRYGDELFVKVVSNIQGYNTEKQDGTGREIIQQIITLNITRDDFKIEGLYIALEPIVLHTFYGLSQYFSLAQFEFIGSTTKRGVYTAGNLVRTSDKNTNIIRNFNDDYYFDVEIDRTFGIGQNGGIADSNAVATGVRKGYFNLILPEAPLELDTNERIVFKGKFAFGKMT